MKKMVRAVLFAVMSVFFTAVFAEASCEKPANLTEIDGVYRIGTCGDLYKFAEMVNGGETSINGMLTADISVNVGVLTSDGTLSGTNFTQWTPIGTPSIPYKGTFDGNGHTISGLYFNDENVDYVGLFGFIGDKSKVQNVGVVDSYFEGDRFVGGVVGYNETGHVEIVYNTGTVSGVSSVGGVVGRNEGFYVSQVYNVGVVKGKPSSQHTGGVVGYNGANSAVTDVYNTGAVSGGAGVGGVVGSNVGLVSNAYYNTDFYTGSAVGDSVSGVIEDAEGKTTTELASITLPSYWWYAGSGEPVWRNGKLVYKLPGLKDVGSQPELVVFQEKADGYYEISNAQELKWFAQLVNSGTSEIIGKLTADICLNACGEGESVLKADGTLNGDGSNFTQWTPIGTSSTPYTGLFDGNDHVISGLYFSDESVYSVGLFGYIGNNAFVQNVGMEDSYIRGAGTVGVVAGYNNGTVSIVYNTGAVSGGNKVGGVVGVNDTAGIVEVAYNTGAVSGGNMVGGVVGSNYGFVRDVYNTGAVSGEDGVGGVVGSNGGSGTVSNVYNVYNTGTVSGSKKVGGVVGYNAAVVYEAYYSTDVPCEGCRNDYGAGKTTAELASTTLPPLLWVAGSGEQPIVSDGKLVYKLPGLIDVGSQPEIEYTGFQPNAEGFYEISNAQELKWFAQLVNSGATNINGKLTEDIVVNLIGGLMPLPDVVILFETNEDLSLEKFESWTPIGTSLMPYTGTFDGADSEGNAHVISRLYFNDESADNVGLFGYIGEGAKIQNVGVVDSYIKGGNKVGGVVGYNDKGAVSNVNNIGVVSGENQVGGVVGENKGDLSNVYNTGTVGGKAYVGGVAGCNQGSIDNAYNSGIVNGNRQVGGVVGLNHKVYNNDVGLVNNVYNTGTVSGTDNIGGVVGDNGGTLTNGYNSGYVIGGGLYVGGVVGYNGGTVSNVYNTGAVSGGDNVGGVVGQNLFVGTVENAYYNTDFYTGDAVGIGEGTEEKIENVEGKTTAELASTMLPDGFSSEIWVAGSGESFVNNGKLLLKLPGLKNVGSQPEIEYTGFQPNADGFYEISTAQELKWFAQLVNGGATDIKGKLTADICLNACAEGESVLKADGTLNGDGSNFTQWTPIGTTSAKFNGTFDGAGHTISGLYFNDDEASYAGLFGRSTINGSIKNVGVVDSYIKGNEHVGGIVGHNGNCTVSNVFSTSTVEGDTYVGGIAGYNDAGTIVNAYNMGAVSGTNRVAGIAGQNDGTTAHINNVYSSGTISGTNYARGLVGYNSAKKNIDNAYYNTDVFSGKAVGNVDGTNVEGKTTAELAALTIGFEGADFPPLGEEVSPWVKGSGTPVVSNGKLVYKFPGLKIFESQPQPELVLFNVQKGSDGNDYCEIANAEDLFKFAQLVNDGTEGLNAKLTADICLNACGEGESVLKADGTLNGDGADFTPWTPIGVSADVTVIFDGNGHTISGLYINKTSSQQGLFGQVIGNVTISNLGVVDFYVKGKIEVGSLAGQVTGKLNIENCYSAGSVEGETYVGGLVGSNRENAELKIENSYNESSVNASSGIVGGFVGENYTFASLTIANSYNVGPVTASNGIAGGLVGDNENGTLNVLNSYNVGSVDENVFVGGVVGRSEGDARLLIENSFFVKTNCDGDALGGEVKTLDEFANGTVAMLLHNYVQTDCEENCIDGSVWGQVAAPREDGSVDTWPVLVLDGSGKLVFSIAAELNGGSTKDAFATKYEYGTNYVLPIPERANYTFGGWFTDATFTEGSGITEIVSTDFGPKNVYAKWIPVKYTIKVAVNNSAMGVVEGLENSGIYDYGSEVTLRAVAKTGYEFSDWADDVEASAERTIVVTGNITYTANFKEIPASSSSSDAKSSSSEAASSSSEAKSSSSEAKSSSSSAKSSSSSAKSSSSAATSSSSDAESSSSEAVSSSSEAKSSSSEAKSSSSAAASSSSEAKSSSSSAKSSSSSAKSSSSDAKSSSSQKESIIARAALPQFSVTASGKMVSIAGARPNTIVNVFDLQGNLVKTVVAPTANFTFALPSAGVYIVKNGYTAKRVNVR